MRRENGKTFARSCVMTALVATSLLAVRSYAQDRGSEHIRNVVVNNDLVAHVLAQSDLLAIGWFHSPPDEESGRRTLFRAEEMEVPFTVVTDFTGRVGPNTVVTIRLNSDMMAFPGESVSRLEKRNTLRRELNLEAEHRSDRLVAIENDLASSKLSLEGYKRELSRLEAEAKRWNEENAELGARSGRPYVSHGYTFYDVNGAIEPGKIYLISVRMIEHDPFRFHLDEWSSLSVFWGEFADEIRLRAQALTGVSSGISQLADDTRAPQP